MAEEEAKIAPPADDGDEIQMFSMDTKKKKPKKDKKAKEGKADKEKKKVDEAAEAASTKVSLLKMEGYKEYTYDELLDRAINQIKSKNPGFGQAAKKIEREDPYVVKIGTTKSCWSNFESMCNAIARKPEHLMSFIAAELGAECRLGGESQLIVTGRFQTKVMEKLYKKYIEHYVTCPNCRSPNTTIEKDPSTRLYMMAC